jgi:phosphatidylinositol 3-kinase
MHTYTHTNRCFATSTTGGMVERIDSLPLSRVLAEYGKDIQRFLRQHHPSPNAPFGIAPEVMDTYIKSCAGYCVVTYLLGVGDRHLDNVLLCPDGRLFHIDFGYILGRDPKPMPLPFKLVREMVDAMGGQNSVQYRRFQQYCSEAYIILRRRGELFINLMMLMKDANIPDINGSWTRTENPERQLYKLWERFHLEMTNEEAYAHMQALISQSHSALVPQVVEWAHKLKQDYWAM